MMIKFLLRWLGGGPLDRVLDTVDRKIKSETNKEKIQGEVVREHLRSRGDWMRAGGFWLLLMFAAPFAYWFAAVCIYSVHWCAGCHNPQGWTIAALPAPLDQWGGWILSSLTIGGAWLARR